MATAVLKYPAYTYVVLATSMWRFGMARQWNGRWNSSRQPTLGILVVSLIQGYSCGVEAVAGPCAGRTQVCNRQKWLVDCEVCCIECLAFLQLDNDAGDASKGNFFAKDTKERSVGLKGRALTAVFQTTS